MYSDTHNYAECLILITIMWCVVLDELAGAKDTMAAYGDKVTIFEGNGLC